MPSRVRGSKAHVPGKRASGTPAAETPAAETPVAETPAAEIPVAEAPVAETAAAQSQVTEAPIVETLDAEIPVTETLAAETPVAEALAAETTVTETPAAEAPVTEVVAAEAPVTETLDTETLVPQKLRSPIMSTTETTASYAELATEGYTLWVDALAAANQRALDYTKSIWQIVTRPYSSATIDTAVRENFDRANQIVSLTIGELQTGAQKGAEFAEKLVTHGAKVQDSYVHAFKGLADTGVSNLKYVTDVAEKQLGDVGKRLEELKPEAVASNN